MTKKTKNTAAESTALTPIRCIKGFGKDMTCRDFKFAPGETFEIGGKIIVCDNGFHACPDDQHPLTVFSYYAPGISRYFDVEVSGETDRHGDKIAAARITIGIELTIPELVRRAWEWVWDRATKSDDSHTTIDQGAASATGTRGAASATGYQGAASATGDQGAASATGYQGAASATGTRGAASATGTRGAASATGFAGRVMGTEGNALFAVEREPYPSYKIISAACGIVGHDGIEPDQWYVCRDGKLVLA